MYLNYAQNLHQRDCGILQKDSGFYSMTPSKKVNLNSNYYF